MVRSNERVHSRFGWSLFHRDASGSIGTGVSDSGRVRHQRESIFDRVVLEVVVHACVQQLLPNTVSHFALCLIIACGL